MNTTGEQGQGLSRLQQAIVRHIWHHTRQALIGTDVAARMQVYEAGIPWRPRGRAAVWRLTTRVDVSRSLARLERRGLVMRMNAGGRTTRVRLTAAGLEAARRLTARRDGC